jgi:SAM-dependent methyltransferase
MAVPPPPLFDRRTIRRRLARAVSAGAADFLLAHAVGDLIERLSVVQRDFPRVLDLGTPSPVLSEQLLSAPGAPSLVRLSPLQETVGPAGTLAFVGDEEALPLAAEQFDLVVSALALHHVNDLPGTLVQLRRVLKPDGLFLGCLLGGRTLEELRVAIAVAETELTGGVSPRVAPCADIRDMGALLQRAGFALPVVDREPLVARYPNLFGLMADLRAMGATNALAARLRKPSTRSLFLRAAEIYAERFADPDGRVRATFELIYVSGWAPHASQRQPLAPGSARMRLADVLGPGSIG